jgi:hypothetical protein
MKNLTTISALLAGLVLSLSGCAGSKTITQNCYLILPYSDFGPQVLAYKAVGYEWWQWDNHGDSRPVDYPIRVVVFEGYSESEIRLKFPVVAGEKKDFRYLTREAAERYLQDALQEANDIDLPKLAAQFEATLSKIHHAFRN